MALKQKSSGPKAVPVGLAIGWGIQMLLTAALCLLLTALILSNSIGQEATAYSAPVILMICAYVGAAVSYKLVGHHNLIVCLSSAALYLGTLLAMAVLVFDGKLGAFWVSALVIFGSAMAALLVCGTPKRNKSGSRKKRRI